MTPLWSHLRQVASTRASKSRVYCNRGSAHGAGTYFTPWAGQVVGGNRECTKIWHRQASRWRRSSSGVWWYTAVTARQVGQGDFVPGASST
jgi:hypothetical protein